MNLAELVKMRGFDITQKIKIVRHQDSQYDVKKLYKQNLLEFYQSVQSKNVFGNCDYILSFLGTEGTKAIYVGAYHKIGMSKFDKKLIPADFPYPDFFNQELNYYHFEKIDLLDDMVGRLVIDWGKAAKSWFQ